MSEFEIADDYVKSTARSSRRNPAIDAVIAGHTVFLPGAAQTTVGASFKRRAAVDGYRVVTRKGERDGVTGVYVWREKRENGVVPT